MALLPLVVMSLAGTLLTVSAQQRKTSAGDSTLARAVFTERDVFWLTGAEMIAGPEVIGIQPAPVGRWVLAVRMWHEMPATLSPPPDKEPGGEVSLLLWDSRTRRTTTLWRQPIEAGQIEDIRWLPRSERALVVARVTRLLPPLGEPEVRRSLLLVDPERSTPRVLATLAGDETLKVSPMQPLAVLSSVVEGRSAFRVVGAGGNVGALLPAPEGAVPSEQWSTDGYQLYLGKLIRSAAEPKKLATEWHALNLGTSTIRALEQPPTDLYKPADPFAEALAALPVRLKQSTATLTEEGTQQTLRPLWLSGDLRSERPRALVASDSGMGTLLPDASAVIYSQAGALYAVPLLRLDKTAYLSARRAAQKAVTISNAKQLGLGLMMYAQDYDETYPPADDPMEVLLPYIKNRTLFNNPASGEYGFVYLFNSRGLASIEAPAETVMGYLSGPGGRAAIYADGHVKWEDDAR